jgi:hypothetical protein
VYPLPSSIKEGILCFVVGHVLRERKMHKFNDKENYKCLRERLNNKKNNTNIDF